MVFEVATTPFATPVEHAMKYPFSLFVSQGGDCQSFLHPPSQIDSDW